MGKENFIKVFVVMSILLMLMPVMAMAEKIPVAILRTNADGKTKTLTFTYAERPKVFAKRGQNGIHKLNPLGSPGQEPLPSWLKMPSDGMIDERSTNTEITTVIFDKTFSQARPVTCSMWFYNLKRLTTIKGIENLNTSDVKSMFSMFEGCSKLDSINVSGFDTSNVEEMYAMFSGCSKLTDLDVSGFNTNNVTDMCDMFEGCSNLKNIDVSGFNTSNVKVLGGMFEDCSNLKNIDVSGFNTSNVYIFVDNMFSGCSKLECLDISSLNLNNIIRKYTESIEGISGKYLSAQGKVDRLKSHFNSLDLLSGCTGLKKLNIGNNDFTSLNSGLNMGNIFKEVGTFDEPCQLIVGQNFNKSVLGVKHDNGKDGFYRWLGGYFALEATESTSSDTSY